MGHRNLVLRLLVLLVSWPILTAAMFPPSVPFASPLPFILGVERISPVAWALLVGCHYSPHDIRVWTETAPPQHPHTITASGHHRWRVQFTGSLPASATVYGCGQQAVLIVAAESSQWLSGLVIVGITVTGLLGLRLLRMPRAAPRQPSVVPTTARWQAQICDEEGERTITLAASLLTVGSDPACHLIVIAADIAPRHAQIILSEQTAQIVDLASPAGVFSGPVRQRLRPHTPTYVAYEDIWLGATVRLRLNRIPVETP
ncbi:MAG: hypothetical protein KatS3mg055_1129 [Chloroflexus sp.]|uniref:FHA domain-containing protein n=1 Tax=Chloroflexus sp. TaxID=1904827 RepID=UPI0021DDB341|nr:FHA domain-containing protein [Chloroflexus sp.]GIV88611.1 MAG: hypothetical protein KatS3mg055_1129 [Chloroflexus sp.]